MLVQTRFEIAPHEATQFRDELEGVRAMLARQTGCLDAVVGRNVDDPQLWTLTTRWRDVGSYRRALGTYEVKMHGVPVLCRAMDEPSAYEVVEPGADLNVVDGRSVG